MNILSYVHPISTYLPCTGVGRHINKLVLGLDDRDEIDLHQLLFSKQWLTDSGKLDRRSPLSPLPFITFPWAENTTERNWKTFGFPRMDRYIPDRTDWLYAPMGTYIPVAKCPVAMTLHDIQAFEPDLPWSRTWQHQWFAYKWSRWVPKALNECRVILTVSEFSKQRMVDLLGANPKQIEVVGNGVDESFFEIGKVDPTSPRSTNRGTIYFDCRWLAPAKRFRLCFGSCQSLEPTTERSQDCCCWRVRGKSRTCHAGISKY